MANVIIHGFKNEEAAQQFISWFCGQGEQHMWEFWDIMKEDKDIGENVTVDSGKTFVKGKATKDEAGNLIMHVRNE